MLKVFMGCVSGRPNRCQSVPENLVDLNNTNVAAAHHHNGHSSERTGGSSSHHYQHENGSVTARSNSTNHPPYDPSTINSFSETALLTANTTPNNSQNHPSSPLNTAESSSNNNQTPCPSIGNSHQSGTGTGSLLPVPDGLSPTAQNVTAAGGGRNSSPFPPQPSPSHLPVQTSTIVPTGNPRFPVTTVGSKGKTVRGTLEVTENEIILHRPRHADVRWPLHFLRRYGHEPGVFSFESGRRCESGPGIFTFHSAQADEVFHLVQQHIQNSASTQFGGALPPVILERGGAGGSGSGGGSSRLLSGSGGSGTHSNNNAIGNSHSLDKRYIETQSSHSVHQDHQSHSLGRPRMSSLNNHQSSSVSSTTSSFDQHSAAEGDYLRPNSVIIRHHSIGENSVMSFGTSNFDPESMAEDEKTLVDIPAACTTAVRRSPRPLSFTEAFTEGGGGPSESGRSPSPLDNVFQSPRDPKDIGSKNCSNNYINVPLQSTSSLTAEEDQPPAESPPSPSSSSNGGFVDGGNVTATERTSFIPSIPPPHTPTSTGVSRPPQPYHRHCASDSTVGGGSGMSSSAFAAISQHNNSNLRSSPRNGQHQSSPNAAARLRLASSSPRASLTGGGDFGRPSYVNLNEAAAIASAAKLGGIQNNPILDYVTLNVGGGGGSHSTANINPSVPSSSSSSSAQPQLSTSAHFGGRSNSENYQHLDSSWISENGVSPSSSSSTNAHNHHHHKQNIINEDACSNYTLIDTAKTRALKFFARDGGGARRRHESAFT